MPKISVVVPVYNQELYLHRSIAALKGQVFSDIEIIMVNDGSTDSSLRILKKAQAEDARIRIINQQNAGLVSAIITGIRAAVGDYIAFVDPDDTVGQDFLNTLYVNNNQSYDIIAAGFFYVNGRSFTPFPLKRRHAYLKAELPILRENFIKENNILNISNLCGIPRWNKLYKKKLLMKVVPTLEEHIDITLGEDTIFTYLCLRYAESVLTLDIVNSYYYKVDNSKSMMSNSSIEKHIHKASLAFNVFSNLLQKNGESVISAHIMFYYEVQALLNRLDGKEYINACREVQKSSIYESSLTSLMKSVVGRKDKMKLLFDRINHSGHVGLVIRNLRNVLRTSKYHLSEVKKLIGNATKKGIARAARIYGHDYKRYRAFEDLREKMPQIEREIRPFLQKYVDSNLSAQEEPMSNNVFVFWWSGFSSAPAIVKICRNSLNIGFPDANIIELDKNNYRRYTDIDSIIIEAFEKDVISIQTFSDILRFNVLKNNGGVWVDATLYFTDSCNLLKNLEDKSFESVEFDSTNRYLQYKNIACSWTGFLIASKKHDVLVTAVDDVFYKYFLKFKKYPIYFFIDAVLMICKINKIGCAELNKIQKVDGDLFELVSLLPEQGYPEYLSRQGSLPQKLYWDYRPVISDKVTTFDLLSQGQKK